MQTLDQDYAPIAIGDRDDIGSNWSTNRPLVEIAGARLSRRAVLKGFVTTAAMGAVGGTLTSRVALAASSFGFQSLPQAITEDMQVAPGYSAQLLIRWGDPVLPGAPEFDPLNQTAAAQARQFGYNNRPSRRGPPPGDLGDELAQHRIGDVRQARHLDHKRVVPGPHMVLEVAGEARLLLAQDHGVDADPGRRRPIAGEIGADADVVAAVGADVDDLARAGEWRCQQDPGRMLDHRRDVGREARHPRPSHRAAPRLRIELRREVVRRAERVRGAGGIRGRGDQGPGHELYERAAGARPGERGEADPMPRAGGDRVKDRRVLERRGHPQQLEPLRMAVDRARYVDRGDQIRIGRDRPRGRLPPPGRPAGASRLRGATNIAWFHLRAEHARAARP
jgi:hypothetical protein